MGEGFICLSSPLALPSVVVGLTAAPQERGRICRGRWVTVVRWE